MVPAPPSSHTRRALLKWASLAGIGVAAAACAAPTAAPTAAPAPTSAAAKPAASSAAASQPAASPAASKPATPAAAATAAPAKRTFQPADVKIAYSTSSRVESARLVGVKQGFFREFGIGLEPVILSGTPNIIRSMIGNESTFGSGDVLTTLSAIETGSPIKFLATYEATLPFVLFVSPQIKSAKDLEGKSMGTTGSGSLADNITRLILAQQGVDASKIEFAAIQGTANVYKAIVGGKVDGGLAQDANLATAGRDGVVPLLKAWEILPKLTSSSFMATDEAIQKNRDQLVRTLAGYVKTFRFINTPPSRAVWVDAATKELQQEPGQAEQAWDGAFEAKTYRPDLAFNRDEYEYMQQLNIDAGHQKQAIPFERATDLSLLKDALALTGA